MEHVLDHEDQAIARLIEQFKNSESMRSLIAAFVAQVQEIEDALWQLYTERALDTAIGTQLDVLGSILGEDRNGFDDTDYRSHLLARVRLNLSSATAPEILSIFTDLTSGAAELILTEDFPAGFTLTITGYPTSSAYALFLLNILRLAAAGGVRAQMVWSESADADTFHWDGTSDQAWDNGALADAGTV